MNVLVQDRGQQEFCAMESMEEWQVLEQRKETCTN